MHRHGNLACEISHLALRPREDHIYRRITQACDPSVRIQQEADPVISVRVNVLYRLRVTDRSLYQLRQGCGELCLGTVWLQTLGSYQRLTI